VAFDVITPKKLVNQELALANETLYTVPENTRVFVKDINITNSNAAAVNITLYLVDSGGSTGVSNALLGNVQILGNDVAQWFGSQVIEAGDTIQGFSDTANVCIKISGGLAV
jgi:hypothetical protein